jgi:DnaJ-domain-containing protein 1
MQLPGRLRATTLGDVLGALHRAAATGTLELADDRGRTHRVYLVQGLVAAVDVEDATPPLAEILRRDRAADDQVLRQSILRAMTSQRLLGEVLVDDFRVAPSVVGRALRQQILARLALIERMADARISFRVAVRAPRGALGSRAGGPLAPGEFLHGRRRARERTGHAGPSRTPARVDESAWHVLGLEPGAGTDAIRRAYRRLARTLHPDLHPQATDEERRSLSLRFAEVSEAYRTLSA